MPSVPDDGIVTSGNAPDIPNANDDDEDEGERKETVNALANTLERIRQEKIEDERRKILDGTYPSRVIQGRQNKHIEGTREFEQNQTKMRKMGGEPSILEADAQELVDTYKGTGSIKMKSSIYPRERIDTGSIVGKTWVKSISKYVDTRRIEIFYSSTGVHVVPVSDYAR